MRSRARVVVLATLVLAAVGLAREARSDGSGRAVTLVKMPYRGERNVAELSDSPEYLANGGLPARLEQAGWRVAATPAVALSPEEQKAYGEWNRLGLANGQLARIVAAEVQAGRFPVGLLANCSALMGMLGGLQHAGPTAAPLRVGLVFIDAHGDFNTPETTLSGMLGGMPVAISAGLGLTRLRVKSGLDPAVPENQIVLAAARDLDPLEKDLLDHSAVQRLTVDDIKTKSPAIDAQMKRLSSLSDLIYVHVDMDVLDPPEVRGHPLTVPGGPTSAELAAALTTMFRYEKAAAFGVASTPSGDQDKDGRSREAAYRLVLGALEGVRSRGAAAVERAQEANEDESKVPPYVLPDPLVLASGRKVTDAATWMKERRPELMRRFESQVYGRTPSGGPRPRFELGRVDASALGGRATRKEVAITFGEGVAARRTDLLVFVPKGAKGPVPAFLALSFQRNDALKAPVEAILDRGYALATAYYGDLFPDRADGAAQSVLTLFPPREGGEAWGAIGVWAWTMSRALDYLETDPAIDARRVAVLGHSRIGKAALWAGAQDPRFAIVISNESGCGGAALSKRIYGETVAAITSRFPHWFCPNFARYADHEADLPVDQHELLALIAPRPLYVASAMDDHWADPKGEFLAALGADPVYRLLGTDGLPVREPPPVDQPVQGTIGYHVRSGGHDLSDYDWRQYLDFADKHFRRR